MKLVIQLFKSYLHDKEKEFLKLTSGAKARNVSFKTLCSGQFILSTHLVNQKNFAIPH